MRKLKNHDEQLVQEIQPYWSDDQKAWVFDDPAMGLRREPFIQGTSDVISRLVGSVPAAKQGFRLFFSATPFPAFQLQLLQQFSERGAYCYVTADSFRTVWLCSALLQYFTEAPSELYIRAEPKDFGRHIVGE
jgi:hypothetical protein